MAYALPPTAKATATAVILKDTALSYLHDRQTLFGESNSVRTVDQ
ncbi:MAG: hypothetical protein J07HQW2_03206 [Haloquadratum walsbyi J07HQW2]|uniref:Uncharacterized protein n=1 Tax=Haloquadratum walsbyi J07HQW2 TaxID=1238425 RepID=U1NII2_9EURY|nr:MAG: hypothetical protein J07HQW2_03206 [Haloquadratum walsbyi J07HQW2]